MSKVPLVLNAVDANGRGLRVSFRWRGDRFSHSIALVDGSRDWTLLESVEGSSGQSWPPSPPLQQLVTQNRGAALPVILGIGMSGKNHWSFSAEATPSRALIQFDVACRLKNQGDHLGSRFRLNIPSIAMTGPNGGEAEFSVGSLRCRLVTEASVEGLQGAIEFGDGGLMIRAAEGPSTARWRYKLFIPA